MNLEPGSSDRPITIIAMGSAALMIAYQVASKAVRDTLFLSSFDVRRLPVMVAGAALFSIVVALLTTRALAAHGPARVIPAGFAASALLTIGEWGLALRNPGAAGVVVYLHVAALTPALLSGFWSILNERLDLRTAKAAIGPVFGAGTLGGLVAGWVAMQLAAWGGVSSTLPALAMVHGCSAGLLLRLARRSATEARSGADRSAMSTAEVGRRLIARSYLRNLTLLTLGSSVSAALLDYVFKAQATTVGRQGLDLMRVFSLFYATVALLTLMIQTLLTRWNLEAERLPITVGTLPGSVVLGGTAAAVALGPWSVGIARGLESVLRGSLFRPGYEALYMGIPRAERRATKTLVDVGCDRLGEGIGAGIIAWVLVANSGDAHRVLLVLAVVLAVCTLGVTPGLLKGYVKSLEEALRPGEEDLGHLDDQNLTTRITVLNTLHPPDRPPPSSAPTPPVTWTRTAEDDPLARAMQELRSGDAPRVRAVLTAATPLDPALVPEAINLLAWDAVKDDAIEALHRVAARHVGQLVDALLDPGTDFAVRRRIPAVLVACPTSRVVEGLTRGLAADRFEVRYRCGRALARMFESECSLKVDHEMILSAVRREASQRRALWQFRPLLDPLEDSGSAESVDDFLRDRAGQSLDHVFRLLSLVLPREPLRDAFRVLQADDQELRGQALEYLEIVLPASVREVLWPHLETGRTRGEGATRPGQDTEAVLEALRRSNVSIVIRLEALRKQRGERGGPDEPSKA